MADEQLTAGREETLTAPTPQERPESALAELRDEHEYLKDLHLEALDKIEELEDMPGRIADRIRCIIERYDDGREAEAVADLRRLSLVLGQPDWELFA